ncbi:unnamed protein product [Candida parapsilosis]|nr:hypothetical protein K4G60_g287 [Candida parapsilosis]KAI5907391.1 hypothetical protein K4G61_g1052 [Candida parapsilosis]CAD1812655.1 unnamed protein product [Candida parapsilosis]
MPPRSTRPMNSQTQWKDQASSQSPQNSNEPAYTLPGVINYLTSEFTNLERFKIMTNLEKSEMKYKILHLEGEIKTLKYANQKQQARIESLEKENRLLKSKNRDNSARGEPLATNTPSEPDLESIKKSRQQLKDSMKEIISLLRSPSTRLGELNISEANQREIEEMIDNSEDDFVFGRGPNSPKSNLISQFFNDDDDDDDDGNNNKAEKAGDCMEEVLERSITNESDVTVIDGGDIQQVQPEIEAKHENASTRSFENDGVNIVLTTLDDKTTITTSMDGNTSTKDVTISQPKDVQNIFALPHDTHIIVEKDIIVLPAGGGQGNVLIPAKSSFSQINASAIIDMTASGDEGRVLGLAIGGFSNGTKSFLSKAYQITIDKQLQCKEIGSFNRKFLTKNKGGSDITFVGWNRDASKSPPPSSPKKSTKSASSSLSKNRNKNDSVPRLGSYDVIYQIGDQKCKVNLLSKQVSSV